MYQIMYTTLKGKNRNNSQTDLKLDASVLNLQSMYTFICQYEYLVIYVSFSFLLAINNEKFKANTFHKGVEIQALRAGMGCSLLCYFA